jgi:hypothetical protein
MLVVGVQEYFEWKNGGHSEITKYQYTFSRSGHPDTVDTTDREAESTANKRYILQ